jgi:hypothetical protein
MSISRHFRDLSNCLICPSVMIIFSFSLADSQRPLHARDIGKSIGRFSEDSKRFGGVAKEHRDNNQETLRTDGRRRSYLPLVCTKKGRLWGHRHYSSFAQQSNSWNQHVSCVFSEPKGVDFVYDTTEFPELSFKRYGGFENNPCYWWFIVSSCY